MKVMAKRLGYYGDMRRRVGQVFEIKDEKSFSKNWMERVDTKSSKKAAAKEEAVEPTADQDVI